MDDNFYAADVTARGLCNNGFICKGFSPTSATVKVRALPLSPRNGPCMHMTTRVSEYFPSTTASKTFFCKSFKTCDGRLGLETHLVPALDCLSYSFKVKPALHSTTSS